MLNNNFNQVFGYKPIIGMIHLAGNDPIKRGLEELEIYNAEGVDAAIIENYHNTNPECVESMLKALQDQNFSLKLGINILPNEFEKSLDMAEKYNADFIQLDHVAGRYFDGRIELDFDSYSHFKSKHPDKAVLGGVWPKYYPPAKKSFLEDDLRVGIERAEAIVVTGEGTGKSTPLDKIKLFREIIGKHPLIVGAGMTPENASKQLSIADGAIVGTYFKSYDNTENPVNRERVRTLMDIVKKIREN
jgi:uncharacterized protein